jgi:hypothetical protein
MTESKQLFIIKSNLNKNVFQTVDVDLMVCATALTANVSTAAARIAPRNNLTSKNEKQMF